MSDFQRYGVREVSVANDEFDVAAEEIHHLGFATLDAGLAENRIDALSAAFDNAAGLYRSQAQARGHDLDAVGEEDVIRALPAIAPEFMELLFNDRLHKLLSRLLGDYYIVNQANGLINRAGKGRYGQAAYHRDLPYQHFVSSRPLAINALFALDDFTVENGATRVVPASQHREAFPSDELVRRLSRQVTAPRGTFIVLDCMLFHAGGINTATRDRRAVNHVFTIPLLRQQLHMPSVIGNAEGLSEWQRKVLGFGLDEYRSVDDWLLARTRKQ
jgi:ectoine hydroxylase-related dioxygenase (phytanoyl-CoA dioxygenase family)